MHPGDIVVVKEDTAYVVDMSMKLRVRNTRIYRGASWTKMSAL